MMKTKIKGNGPAFGARGRRLHMGACPHCRGDVRQARDLYGAYLQCIQCSREISAERMAALLAASAVTNPAPPAQELLVA